MLTSLSENNSEATRNPISPIAPPGYQQPQARERNDNEMPAQSHASIPQVTQPGGDDEEDLDEYKNNNETMDDDVKQLKEKMLATTTKTN